jgi:hypothetical protein
MRARAGQPAVWRLAIFGQGFNWQDSNPDALISALAGIL